MIEKAAVLPTGDEIQSGVVLDTDSPEIIRQLVMLNPGMEIIRRRPLSDDPDKIRETILSSAAKSDLVILIGGSGGGHRCSESLGKDFTHTALSEILTGASTRELYGKNGHLWCKLMLGRIGNALVFNLPGPFVEAKAAMEAFCKNFGCPANEMIDAMAKAVIAQYPTA